MARSRNSSRSSDSSSDSSHHGRSDSRRHQRSSTRGRPVDTLRNKAVKKIGAGALLGLAQSYLAASFTTPTTPTPRIQTIPPHTPNNRPNMPPTVASNSYYQQNGRGRGTESSPLLNGRGQASGADDGQGDLTPDADVKTRGIVWGTLTLLFVAALVLVLGFPNVIAESPLHPWLGLLPKDPMLAAMAILDNSPVIVRGFSLLSNSGASLNGLWRMYVGRSYW